MAIRGWALVVILIGCVCLIWVSGMLTDGKGKGVRATKATIVDFELARTPAKAGEIVRTWTKADQIDAAITVIKADYVFVLGYALGLAALCWGSASTAADRLGPWAGQAGRGLAVAVLVAGVFDVIENVFMLKILNRRSTVDIPGHYTVLAWAFASLKFRILILAGIWLLTVLAICLLVRPSARA